MEQRVGLPVRGRSRMDVFTCSCILDRVDPRTMGFVSHGPWVDRLELQWIGRKECIRVVGGRM